MSSWPRQRCCLSAAAQDAARELSTRAATTRGDLVCWGLSAARAQTRNSTHHPTQHRQVGTCFPNAFPDRAAHHQPTPCAEHTGRGPCRVNQSSRVKRALCVPKQVGSASVCSIVSVHAMLARKSCLGLPAVACARARRVRSSGARRDGPSVFLSQGRVETSGLPPSRPPCFAHICVAAPSSFLLRASTHLDACGASASRTAATGPSRWTGQGPVEAAPVRTH